MVTTTAARAAARRGSTASNTRTSMAIALLALSAAYFIALQPSSPSLRLLPTVCALPQGPTSSPSSSSPSDSTSSSSNPTATSNNSTPPAPRLASTITGGTVIGTISIASSSASASAAPSLPPNFTLPDPNPSNNGTWQNTTDLPSTPLGPLIPDLPEYAITYAPILYLDQNESYWPSSLDVHLDHVTPWIDYTPVPQTPDPLTLENLNFTLSTSLFLSMDDPAESPRPEWLYSRYGKPDPSGFSQSNLTVIAVNKTESIQSGVVDVFYFLFYSFNDGSDVGGQKYGNHISDIEYVMTRFYSGKPKYIFLSQHEDGEAYEWSAVQKEGERPIVYSAIGGHANYPVAGTFELVPGLQGLLEDQTSAGTRWDVAKNYNAYWYSRSDGFVPANGTRSTTLPGGEPPGIGYLQQTGKWGNEALPESNPNQAIIFGKARWSDGATGPIDPSKAILRTWLCVQSDCSPQSSLPQTVKLQAGQTPPKGATGLSVPFPPIASLALPAIAGSFIPLLLSTLA